jgi:hypothetical protein
MPVVMPGVARCLEKTVAEPTPGWSVVKIVSNSITLLIISKIMTMHGRVAYKACTATIQPDGVQVLEIAKEEDVVTVRMFKDVVDWMRDVERRTGWFNSGPTAHEMMTMMNRRFVPPVSVDGREWGVPDILFARSMTLADEEETRMYL